MPPDREVAPLVLQTSRYTVAHMEVPLLLLTLSLVGVGVALAVPGLADILLLAGTCAVASLFLLLIAFRRGRRESGQTTQPWIVVDGSNVMHWKGGTPEIGTVREVVEHLVALGFVPGVVFDANAGHKMNGRYQHDGALGKLLGLPEDRVMVVPKGTPADPTNLAAARDLGAQIVTNDRFRDWAEAHPEVTEAGHLVREDTDRANSGLVLGALVTHRPFGAFQQKMNSALACLAGVSSLGRWSPPHDRRSRSRAAAR